MKRRSAFSPPFRWEGSRPRSISRTPACISLRTKRRWSAAPASKSTALAASRVFLPLETAQEGGDLRALALALVCLGRGFGGRLRGLRRGRLVGLGEDGVGRRP